MSGRVLLSQDSGIFLEMSEVNLEPEVSLSAGVSVTISVFDVDSSKLVKFPKDAMFMFLFDLSTLTGVRTFIT